MRLVVAPEQPPCQSIAYRLLFAPSSTLVSMTPLRFLEVELVAAEQDDVARPQQRCNPRAPAGFHVEDGRHSRFRPEDEARLATLGRPVSAASRLKFVPLQLGIIFLVLVDVRLDDNVIGVGCCVRRT